MRKGDDPSGVEIDVAAPSAPAAEWIRIAGGDFWADQPRWAPDGKTLYFVSNKRSSLVNLWGIRFDSPRGC